MCKADPLDHFVEVITANGEAIPKYQYSDRPDRLRKYLPNTLREMIEAKRFSGARLKKEWIGQFQLFDERNGQGPGKCPG
jgi:hypothetical protein